MPFKSQAQRAMFYAKGENDPKWAARAEKWEKHTPKGKKLPKHVDEQDVNDDLGVFEDSFVDVDESPKMSEVFSSKPPPGSKPFNASKLTNLGSAGQSAKTGLDALKKTGQYDDAYSTPDGQVVAYPKDPNGDPLKVDMMHGGVWMPATSGSSASGTKGF